MLNALRAGEMSIHRAYVELGRKPGENRRSSLGTAETTIHNYVFQNTEVENSARLQSIGDEIKTLLGLVEEGDATPKMIVEKLMKLSAMIDEMSSF